MELADISHQYQYILLIFKNVMNFHPKSLKLMSRWIKSVTSVHNILHRSDALTSNFLNFQTEAYKRVVPTEYVENKPGKTMSKRRLNWKHNLHKKVGSTFVRTKYRENEYWITSLALYVTFSFRYKCNYRYTILFSINLW